MEIVNIIIIFALILVSAYFVATEFAIIKIRRSKIEQLALEGNKSAISLLRVLDDIDAYLSACQLGITMTSLIIGWLGEPAVGHIFRSLFDFVGMPESAEHILSFILAFLFVTVLHVVLGELAPKTIAIQKAEWMSLKTAPLLQIFYKGFYPLIWVLNGLSNLIVKLFGFKPVKEGHEEAHSEEELLIILSKSLEDGKINQNEYKYFNKVFEFDERLAKEIMTPRTDMICLSQNLSLQENLKIIESEQYTRYPVILENKDNVIGIVNTKKLLLSVVQNKTVSLDSFIQTPVTFLESTPINVVFKKMQKERSYMALLIDEYGGTSGLITMEDIIEELVGEIRDEFDGEEKPSIEKIEDNHYHVDGKVLLTEINDLLGIEIEDEEIDTIGGWLYSQTQNLKQGASLEFENTTFIIKELRSRRICKVEILKQEPIN